MLDCHVHIKSDSVRKNDFRTMLGNIDAEGAVVLSLPPENFFAAGRKYTSAERLENVLNWCRGEKDLYPFLWIDPVSENAAWEIAESCGKGIAGFKVICDRFYPSDKKAMKVFKLIAASGKPVLFHSGILWDGKVSSKYNRPMEFECLLEVPGLKFALAHVSWPWCDELIALYGKFLNALSLNSGKTPEMYIDTTPGTPLIYREDTLKKLYTVGYDVENNVIFGSDSYANDYNAKWVMEWTSRDRQILKSVGLDNKQIEKYFSGNLRRFVSGDASSVNRKSPLAGN